MIHHKCLYGFCVAISLLVCQISYCQFPQLFFETYQTNDGLSSNNISCVYQDSKGFLWIGTDFGLNKFDGNVFINYYSEINNPNSLSGNHIVDILEDAEGIFWIATKDGGLTRYAPNALKGKQFMQFKHVMNNSNTIPTNRLITLFDYNSEYILAGAEVSPFIFINKKNYKITVRNSLSDVPYFPDPNTGMENIDPNWTHKMKFINNNYFLSILYRGLVFIFDKNGNPISRDLNYSESSSVTDFILIGDTLWLASWWQGLYIKKLQHSGDSILIANEQLHTLNDNITCILQLNDSIILAGSQSSGIFMVDRRTHAYKLLVASKNNNYTLPSNNINCLYKDTHGNVWVGTHSGLAKYNSTLNSFSAYQFTGSYSDVAQTYSVHISKDNTIRICTSNGIFKKQKDWEKFQNINLYSGTDILTPNYILELGDTTYLGTESNLFWYDLQNETVKPVPLLNYSKVDGENKLVHGQGGLIQIRSITADTINNTPVLLMAVLGNGMSVLDINKNVVSYLYRIDNEPNSIQNNMTRIVYKDWLGDIWVGCSEGLYQWQKSFPPKNIFTSFFYNANDAHTISHNAISGIYKDADSMLWVSTLGGGLNKWDGEKFERYYTGILKGDKMYGVYPDKSGRLWCPVQFGFEVFVPEESKYYQVVMSSEDFTLHENSKLLIDENGNFIYASSNTLIAFNPNLWSFESTFPDIYLQDILLFNKSISNAMSDENITFNYNQNFISFIFSALDLTTISKPVFQYKLSGISSEWLPVETPNHLTFNSLPHGRYSLELRVSNRYGQWSPPVVISNFQILRPFWLQWWFYLLVICIAGGFTYGWMRNREQQFLKIQTVRNKIANDLHDDVGSALSTINLYSEVAKMKSEKENNELIEILDKISSTSIEMQENMSHIVWSLQSRNDYFEQVVLKLKYYASEALDSKNIQLDFNTHESIKELQLSSEQRKELFLIFKEAINNIVKYANCSLVKIYFVKQKDLLLMRIIDNGIGFNTQQQTAGNGLHSMRHRAETLHGELQITSEVGTGTEIWLRFNIK